MSERLTPDQPVASRRATARVIRVVVHIRVVVNIYVVVHINVVMTHSQMLGKFEYTRGPIFKVVLEC